MMTCSPGSALKEFRSGPLFFFDQPGRDRTKGTRTNILHFNLAKAGGVRLDTITSNLAKESKSEVHNVQTVPSDGSDKHDPTASTAKKNPDIKTSGGMDDSSVDIYKHAAPQLLKELDCLLAQHRWTEGRCVPHGFVNILNSCSWRDMTSGPPSLRLRPGEGGKDRKSKGSIRTFDETLQRLNANCDKRKADNGNPVVVGNVGHPERKAKADPNVLTKKSGGLSNGQKAHASTTISFSMSSNICKEQGWIIQPSKDSFLDKPQQTCQWVLDRLQKATVPIKQQATEEAKQGLNKPLILRCYGDDDKPYLKTARPVTLVNGMPRIPEVKGEVPLSQKLHYRINDGSSLVYYPSGRVAVCQSHSGLPCGGFYTNVFCDSDCPVTLASVTAFGHGTVTHPISGTITAVWDQSGGLMFDPDGTVTKEWTWQAGARPKEKTLLQVSEVISIRLFSGTSAMISFRTHSECVKLFLSALSNAARPKDTPGLQTVGPFTSNAAQELMQANKRKKTVTRLNGTAPTESESVLLALKPVCVHSQEVLQMDKEMEGLEEQPPVMWRGRARCGRELSRLQRRVRNTLEDWLEHYRIATGIECPDTEQMPDAPLRTRLRRDVQSAALPSLTPPEQPVTQQGHPAEGSVELRQQGPPRHLSAPADYILRTPKKRVKEESHVTQIGTLRVRSNIKLDSVVVPRNPSSAVITSLPAAQPSSSVPSLPPISVCCPALLRAALLGERMLQQRWLCCCSCRSMPLLTDLEYDVFIHGQPVRCSEQIIVVCVTPPRRQPLGTPPPPHVDALSGGQLDALEQLHESMNKGRSAPCTQCQMDSFRLVRYEVSTGRSCPGVQHNALLQHRHNAGQGMVLMYIRGKLLFADYIFNGYCCSARTLQKQISRTRGDYRLGQSLPPDYRFSVKIDGPGARTLLHPGDPSTSTPVEVGGPEGTTPPLEKKRTQTSSRTIAHCPEMSLPQKRDAASKAVRIPPAPVSVATH